MAWPRNVSTFSRALEVPHLNIRSDARYKEKEGEQVRVVPARLSTRHACHSARAPRAMYTLLASSIDPQTLPQCMRLCSSQVQAELKREAYISSDILISFEPSLSLTRSSRDHIPTKQPFNRRSPPQPTSHLPHHTAILTHTTHHGPHHFLPPSLPPPSRLRALLT